jgi:hypothetical protein
MKDHPKFVERMDTFAFEIAKGSWGENDKFDSKLVKEMLQSDFDYEKLNFHAWQLLWVWKNYHQIFCDEY